tara:strand:+ start:1326 stop:2459 length:1134 start_codon:yes stop_codon:yes gene_type:complete
LGGIFSNLRLRNRLAFFILFFYSLYSLLHFVGDTELILLFEGFRHEVLFVLLAFSLLVYGLSRERSDFLPSLDIVGKTILINGFFSALFGIWQYFDISILETLYRSPLEEIGSIRLAIGYRLAGTMFNPINFATFLVLFFLVINYFHERRKVSFIVYYFSLILVTGLVVGSLSRLALMSLFTVLSFIYFYKISVLRLLFFLSLIFPLMFYFFYNLDLETIMSRLETIFVLSTYTENARFEHWIYAISNLEPYQYLWGKGIGASSPDYSVTSVTSALPIENAFVSIFLQYGVFGITILLSVVLRYIYIGCYLSKIDLAKGKFILGFLLLFIVMSLGNDFLRNSPFVLYFWFFYVYVEVNYSIIFNRQRLLKNSTSVAR